MAAVYVSNLVLNTVTTFSQTFTLEDSESNSTLDLTGYSVNSQMKKHPSSSTKTTFDATVLNASGGINKSWISINSKCRVEGWKICL